MNKSILTVGIKLQITTVMEDDEIVTMQWVKLTVVSALAVTCLSACNLDNNRQGAGANNDVRMNNIRQNNVRPYDMTRNQMDMNRWDHPRSNNFVSLHNNTRMRMSQEIANQIAGMPEVRSANVLLTDKNAYVAVVLNEGVADTARGVRNMGDNQGATRDEVMMRSKDFQAAKVGNVPDVIKSVIARKVQKMNPNVRNVFVSANPDFVDRLNGYAEQFRNGHPLRGMILEFNTAVERLFPQRSATNRTNISPAGPGANGSR